MCAARACLCALFRGRLPVTAPSEIARVRAATLRPPSATPAVAKPRRSASRPTRRRTVAVSRPSRRRHSLRHRRGGPRRGLRALSPPRPRLRESESAQGTPGGPRVYRGRRWVRRRRRRGRRCTWPARSLPTCGVFCGDEGGRSSVGLILWRGHLRRRRRQVLKNPSQNVWQGRRFVRRLRVVCAESACVRACGRAVSHLVGERELDAARALEVAVYLPPCARSCWCICAGGGGVWLYGVHVSCVSCDRRRRVGVCVWAKFANMALR